MSVSATNPRRYRDPGLDGPILGGPPIRPRDLIEEEDVETVQEAAARLGVSPKTVRSWTYSRRGRPARLMPYATVGRRLLLVCAEVDECADSSRSHRNRRIRHAREAFLADSEKSV